VNALRRTVALSDTTDPGTPEQRVDLVFRERAFWLFATGHRLGDLRRLVSRYGRDPNTVFPVGLYRTGESYDAATSIPFPGAHEHRYNSAITGCLSR
jgi:starch-binding outer membrane protein, SusD/RagB family